MPDSAEIQRHDLIEFIVGPLPDRLSVRSTSTVDEDVDPPELPQGGLDQLPAPVSTGDISGYGQRSSSHHVDLFRSGFQRIGAATREHDIGAVLGKDQCGTASDPGAAAGDEATRPSRENRSFM